MLIEGSEAWAIHPDIALIAAQMDEEVAAQSVVLKRASSGFENTELLELLNSRAVDTIITCGLQSEHCVSNTSMAALELGFSVIVARDCHSSFASKELSVAAIVNRQNALLAEQGASVLSVKEIAAGLLQYS